MEAAHDDAEIIFGTVIDESIKDTVKVTVIATGLGGATTTVSMPASAPAYSAPPSYTNHQQSLEQQHSHAQDHHAAPVMSHSAVPPRAPTSVSSPMASMNQSQPQAQAHAPVHQGHAGHSQGMVPNQNNGIQPPPSMMSPPNVPPVSAPKVHTPLQTQAPETSVSLADTDEHLNKESASHVASISAIPAPSMGIGAESGELARARAIAQRLGITNLTDDEYDIPTYMRRQQEREL
jgi:cell division protein FtsZ